MEKRSKHYLDIFLWIQRVIDSCETYPQTISAYKLIRHYYRLMGEMGIDYTSKIHIDNKLTSRLYEKQDEIIKSKLINENNAN
jgi:hypothetical protein